MPRTARPSACRHCLFAALSYFRALQGILAILRDNLGVVIPTNVVSAGTVEEDPEGKNLSVRVSFVCCF